MSASEPKVLIVGGGVAGLAATQAFKTYGVSVDLVEKDARLGGNALKWACMATESCEYCGACLSVNMADEVRGSAHTRIHLDTTTGRIQREGDGFSIALQGASDETLKADAVLLATGMTPYDPSADADLGYGAFDQVVTTADVNVILQQDRLAEILPDTPEPTIAFIQCVGSRNRQTGRDYCSQVCCKTAVRQVNKILHEVPGADITVFHIDLQIIGKVFRSQTAAMQSRVRLHQGVPARIWNDRAPGKVSIIEEDPDTGARTGRHFDLIVLAVGMVPAADLAALTGSLALKTDDWGFFGQSDGLLAPGIYTAGTAQGPTDILSARAQGARVAHRMALDLGWVQDTEKKPSVAILGGSPEAMTMAEALALDGYTPVVLDNGAGGTPPDGVRYHGDVQLTAVSGTTGRFQIAFQSKGAFRRLTAAAIIAATGASLKPGLQTTGEVVLLADFAAAFERQKLSAAQTVVFWLDRNGPEWKFHSRQCLELAAQWQSDGKQAIVVMARMLVHGMQGQRQYDHARHQGVRFLRVDHAGQVTVKPGKGGISMEVKEATLPGVAIDLEADFLVVPEKVEPPLWAAEVSRHLRQQRDPEGFLQSANVRHRPVASPRQGIFFIGTGHDETDTADVRGEIEAVKAALYALTRGRFAVEPPAEIDKARCGRCLTCYRACPHAAVVIQDGIQPLIMADACVGCGICVSSCPAKAIGFVSQTETPAVTAAEGRTVMFACRRSGAPAARAAGDENPSVLLVEVPCAGQIDEQMLLQPLLEGASAVVIAACHEGNCRSMTGSRAAAVRAAKMAAQIGADPSVIRHHAIAANEPGRMAHALAADGYGKETSHA